MERAGRHMNRWDVALRTIAAIPANYALTALITVWLARVLPGPRAEATMGATMLSFAVFAGIAIAAFATRSVARLWVALLVAGAMAGAADAWLITRGGRL